MKMKVIKQQAECLLQNSVDFLNRRLDTAQPRTAELKDEAEGSDGSTKAER